MAVIAVTVAMVVRVAIVPDAIAPVIVAPPAMVAPVVTVQVATAPVPVVQAAMAARVATAQDVTVREVTAPVAIRAMDVGVVAILAIQDVQVARHVQAVMALGIQVVMVAIQPSHRNPMARKKK